MKRKDIAEAFCVGDIGRNATLTSTGDKLISYNTVIAQRLNSNSSRSTVFVLNDTKYSTTSSTHLGYARRYLESRCIPYILTTKTVPYNTQDLEEYL